MGVKLHRGFESRPLRPARWRLGDLPNWPAELSVPVVGSVVFETMTEPMSITKAQDLRGEQVRRQRLRSDGLRPLAMNLRETISLTRKLFELREAVRRAR